MDGLNPALSSTVTASFDNSGFRPKKRLVNAKELGENSIMFLVHPTLTKDEIQQTCDAITSVMSLATK